MRVRYIVLCLLKFFGGISVMAQYAPPAGQVGTTAIYKDSSVFAGWASGCIIKRGLQDTSDASLGYASAGEANFGTGKAGENGVVSLGDGGTATLTFDKPINNGTGYDFAIFENSFSDDFLELAFVEVSSDGKNFFRFPAVSLTDASVQVGSFGATDSRKIYNLAGKYRGLYGTPFDLEELKDKNGLDVTAITHIRVVDVIGSINDAYATFDKDGRKVNDPWPTPFPSGGFDLDAVGVIHFAGLASVAGKINQHGIDVFPNPLSEGQDIYIESVGSEDKLLLEIFDMAGGKVKEQYIGQTNSSISTIGVNRGVYMLKVTGSGTSIIRQVVIQ